MRSLETTPHNDAAPECAATTFNLPIRSFLEAYPHPAFVLAAQPLYETLVQPSSISRASEPKGSTHTILHPSSSANHAALESRARDEDILAHYFAQRPIINPPDDNTAHLDTRRKALSPTTGPTLRAALKPVWANAAWYDMFLALNITCSDSEPDDTLLDMLGPSDSTRLSDFLRARVIAAAGGTHAPPNSVRLELIPQDGGELGCTSNSNLNQGCSNAIGDNHAQIELTATLVAASASAATPRAEQKVVHLEGQYLVMTSISSNVPSRPRADASSRVAKAAVADQERRRPRLHTPEHVNATALVEQGEEGFPCPPALTTHASGDAVPESAQPRVVSPQPYEALRSSHRAFDEADNGNSLIISPDTEPASDTVAQDWTGTGTDPTHREADTAKSAFIPEHILLTDPFCQFLATSKLGRLILAHPWHEGPLGPLVSWAGDLRSLVSEMLASPFRESLWVGEEGIMIYNDQYIGTTGLKHPWILGKPYAVGWAEIWDSVEPYFKRARSGQTVAEYDSLLLMDRDPDNPLGIRREETYHIWAGIPCRGSSGDIIATMNPSFESTSRVLAERRLGTVRDLALTLSITCTRQEFFDAALGILGRNPWDLPFVVCYSCQRMEPAAPAPFVNGGAWKADSYASNTSQAFHLRYEGSLGIPTGHACAPVEVVFPVDSAFDHDGEPSPLPNVKVDENPPWPFREACLTRKPVYVSDLRHCRAGLEQRGWDDEPRAAIVIPIVQPGEIPRAVLIVGLNPRRPFDSAYANWLQLIAKLLATHISITESYSNEVAKAHELAQLDHAKTMFFSNVNHELRTPLTLILGPLNDILADRDTFVLPDAVRSNLQVVSRNANRLLNLVNGLLDFSRLEAGRVHGCFRPINLSSVTADLASLFRSGIKKCDIQYVVTVPEEDVEVWLDLDLWERVLFNIIGNAFKYCLRGSIQVRLRKCDLFAELSVTDTGCGIAEADLEQIFERFHRVEATSRTQEGTGIGLALTQEIVNVLGGTLDVQSVLGQGTTFFVRIPYGTSHLRADQLDTPSNNTPVENSSRALQNRDRTEEASRWTTNELAIESSSESTSVLAAFTASFDVGSTGIPSHDALSIRNSVILLVDGNADMRKYCRSILTKTYQIVEASDGQAALDYARERCPDLIVSDVMMPHLGGYELLKILRENSATALIPVILLSAQAGTEARVGGLGAGADDYLAKPFSSKELLARANTHVHLGKMRRELENQVKERTQALFQSEVRYRTLAEEYAAVTDVSPVGIFSLTPEGSPQFVNPPWHAISGHPVGQPIERWVDSIHPDDRKSSLERWDRAIQHGTPLCTEFRWLHGDRTQCDLRPQFDTEHRLTGWVGSFTNIEERRRLESMHLEAVEQRAKDSEEMRHHHELFIDITSHEMRNLNSGIYNSADLVVSSLKYTQAVVKDLQDGRDIDIPRLLAMLEQDREAAENIMLCSSAQGRIADDILRYSKLSMGLLSINKSDFNLAQAVSEVVAMFSLESSKKKIQLSLEVGPGLEEHNMQWVNADPHRLSQVVINFLTNALRFTVASPVKNITVRVDVSPQVPETTVTAMRVGNVGCEEVPPGALWLTCNVIDSGRGISQDDSGKLFERFAQANPKTDGVGGYGLGLFVSRKIAELHHGFITVESQEGAGSAFSLSVPATRAQPPLDHSESQGFNTTVRGVDEAEWPSSVNPFLAPGPSLESPKARHVLIVEDNPVNSKVLVRQLLNNGLITTTAENGEIALNILLNQDAETSKPKIDVVLMDIEMPVCDGLSAIAKIREYEASGRLSRTKVVALTGNARQEQLDVCRAAGFQHGVVTKPYRLPQLLSMIENAHQMP